MTPPLNRAEAEGAIARKNGAPREKNPHPSGTESRRLWFRGYDNTAREEARMTAHFDAMLGEGDKL